MNFKTGILLPRSVLYPAISFDLLDGLRAGFAADGSGELSVATDNIGVGANDQQIYNSCERLLLDGCTIVAGYVNPATALKLQPLFASVGAVFICMDSGYQFMTPSQQVLPNVITVSLQGLLCCRATADMAVAAGFSSFAFTASFLDAGYRPAYVYARTLEENGAGVVFNHIPSLKRRDFSLEPLKAFLAAEPQHAVLAAYCGDMLTDFCAHAGNGNAIARGLFVSPFMLEETWLEQSDYPGTDLHGTVTWARGLQHAENLDFCTTMEKKGRKPTIFSVLGYEAGQVTARLVKAGSGTVAVDALKGWQYGSPRGSISIDAATNQSLPPLYYAKGVRNEANGKCRLEITGRVAHTDKLWGGLQDDIHSLTDGASTNWLNTYPCIES